MLLLRVILLWSVLSLHVVGAAALFRWLFPRESPWLGFFVPPLAFVVVFNFMEHCVALPSLLTLLPLTTVASLFGIFSPRTNWKGLVLPASIFLASFAFTLGLRCLKPDITTTRDGITDLSLIADFCAGQKLPPECSWFPPLPLNHYYALVHYSASLIVRLLSIDIGTGFNLATALLSALTCVVAAAIAWRVSRHKLWIAILVPILIECAATGSSAYLWLTTENLDPHASEILFLGMDDPDHPDSLRSFYQQVEIYYRSELMVPGSWSWAGACHSTAGGQFLTLLSVFSLVEVLRRRGSNWPWICLAASPVIMCVTSTWGVPVVGSLLFIGVGSATYYRLWPQSLSFVAVGVGLTVIFLLPMLSEVLNSPIMPAGQLTPPEEQTLPAEFMIQWWPVYLPWVALCFVWRSIHPAIRTILIVLPLLFIGVEFYTVARRLDMAGKYWGYIYGIGWSLFFPAIATRRHWCFRALTYTLIGSCVLSLISRVQYTFHTIDWDNKEIFHIEGLGPFRWDFAKSRLLMAASEEKNKIFLTGKSAWAFCGGPPLVNFTGNQTYITWSLISGDVFCGRTHREAYRREKEVNDFYDGACDDPVMFLRSRNITAAVVWPDDHITNNVLVKLKYQLSGYYEYKDFGQRGSPNAGIFIKYPWVDLLPYSN